MTEEQKKLTHITVKIMSDADIPEVRALELQSFNFSWPEESFQKEIGNTKTAYYLVARSDDGRLVGFVGAWFILDEAHITTIALNPEFRGIRVGTMLLWCVFSKAVERGIRWATIEVSEKNTVAQRLYGGFEFKPIGRRKNYYESGDDALVLWKKDMQTEQYKLLLNSKKAEWEQYICLSWE